MKDYETIELDITYEQYFVLNEEARKRELSLDEFINTVLRDIMNDENFLNSLK